MNLSIFRLLTQSRWLVHDPNGQLKAYAERLLAADANGADFRAEAEERRKESQPYTITNLQAYLANPLPGGQQQVVKAEGEELGVRVIKIHGVLTKQDQFSGNYGTDTLARQIAAAAANPNVISILLNTYSPGGEVYGIENLANTIAAAAQQKPVLGFVSDLAASGGYIVIAPATEIILSGKLAEVGSVGVKVTWVDDREFQQEIGIHIRTIYANRSDKKDYTYRQLLEGNEEPLKAEMDAMVVQLEALVRRGRGDKLNTEKYPTIFDADMFSGNDALNAGLVDRVVPATEGNAFDFAIKRAFYLGEQDQRNKKKAAANTKGGKQNHSVQLQPTAAEAPSVRLNPPLSIPIN